MPRTLIPITLCAWVLASAPALAAESSLQCDTGPVNKTYGKTQWMVYSCADGRTLVIHSVSGSLAAPFYFMFHPKDGTYHLYGEGTGNKRATDAAYHEIKLLSAKQIAALIQETKSVPTH